jgi:hypothetical protein
MGGGGKEAMRGRMRMRGPRGEGAKVETVAA